MGHNWSSPCIFIDQCWLDKCILQMPLCLTRLCKDPFEEECVFVEDENPCVALKAPLFGIDLKWLPFP